METLFKILLAIHILGGSLALITGYGAMWVKRGGPRHRSLGKWYVRGMAAVLIAGFPMSIIHPNVFLLGIVFFSAYFVIAGRNAALNRSGMPSLSDKALAWAMIGGAVLAFGAIGYSYFIVGSDAHTFQITGLVFAGLALARGIEDFVEFRNGPITGKTRIRRHLTNMCAGLIATTTAVAVTLVGYLPWVFPIVAWLGPTVLITPLIVRWSQQVMDGKYDFGK